MKKTKDNIEYLQKILNKLTEKAGIRKRKIYYEKKLDGSPNAWVSPVSGNIGVSQEILNLSITEKTNKYMIRLLSHELGHVIHSDNRTVRGRLGMFRKILYRPETKEFNSIRLINTLTETRADLEGLRLAKAVYPELFKEEDMKYAFMLDSNNKKICYLVGYLERSERTKAGSKYLRCNSMRHVLWRVYNNGLLEYGITKEEMLKFLNEKREHSQWYDEWFKFLYNL